MSDFPARDLAYVIRLDEIGWGCLLLALSITVHVIGTLRILRMTSALTARTVQIRRRFQAAGMSIVVVAVLMIVVVHLAEIAIWAGFYVWKDAQPNVFSAFYNALLNYTTLQAGYLPQRWRLLEGMLGMTGLITFAWSTMALYSVAEKFVEGELQIVDEQRA
jgi:hypothetical protein